MSITSLALAQPVPADLTAPPPDTLLSGEVISASAFPAHATAGAGSSLREGGCNL